MAAGKGYEVGVAYMPVLPDFSGFTAAADKALGAQLRAVADKTEKAMSPRPEAGRKSGESAGSAFASGLRSGVSQGWSESRAKEVLDAKLAPLRAGTDSGKRMADGIKASVARGWNESAAKKALDSAKAAGSAGAEAGRAFAARFKKETDDAAKKGGGGGGGLASLIPGKAQIAAGVAAIGGVTLGLGNLAKGYSDLNEAQSKSDQIFSANKATVDRWAQGAAQAFGLSKREALDYGSTMGNMWLQIGNDEVDALKRSQNAMQQSADLASFHNAEITDVIESRTAAYRGEYDSIQRYIPAINAAKVEQQAMIETGKTQASQLTELEKAKAVDTLITQQMGKAAGDFNRTRDEGANKERIFAAELENTKAKMGEALAPAREWVFGIGLQFLTWLGDSLPKAISWAKAKFDEWRPTIEMVGAKIREFWEAYARPALEALWAFIGQRVVPAIQEIWNTAEPALRKTGEIVSWTWTNVIAPALSALWSFITNVLAPTISWLWSNIVRPVFEAIGTAISWTWDNVIRPAFEAIKGGLSSVGTAFSALRDTATRVWEDIKGTIARPINFVIDKINDPFISGINSIASKVGLGGDGGLIPRLGRIPGYAAGGRIPGVTPGPGVDNLWGLVDGRHPVRVASGEWIIRGSSSAKYGDAAMRSVNEGTATIIPGMADGGAVWERMWAWARSNLSGMTLTSGQRGTNDYHGAGKAIDIAAAMTPGGIAAMKRAADTIRATFGSSILELIHPPSQPNILNGRPFDYGPATNSQHYNHVHWAMSQFTDDMAGRAGGSGGGFFEWVKSKVRDALRPLVDNLVGAIPAGTVFGQINRAIAKKMADAVFSFVLGKSPDDPADGGYASFDAPGGTAREAVAKAAASRGWGSGAAWDALSWIIGRESSWNPNAQNPSSTAYGLFQFLDSTWAGVGMAKTSDPGRQAEAGMRYIAARYGDPLRARSFWEANGWYSGGGRVPVFDAGGVLAPGLNTIYNGTGRPEPLVRADGAGLRVYMAFDGQTVREVSRSEYDAINRHAARVGRMTTTRARS